MPVVCIKGRAETCSEADCRGVYHKRLSHAHSSLLLIHLTKLSFVHQRQHDISAVPLPFLRMSNANIHNVSECEYALRFTVYEYIQ